jgi:hypothetical protein
MSSALQLRGELQTIENMVKKVDLIIGDCIEIGVWKGDSAETIVNATSKKVWLLDPWEDFRLHEKDSPTLKGMFFDSNNKNSEVYGNVVARFNRNNVKVVKGYLPECSTEITPHTIFSFAHIDTDVYGGTIEALKFVYPKMNIGGVFIVHDYIHPMTTVKEAVDTFFADKMEKVSVNESQAIITKL